MDNRNDSSRQGAAASGYIDDIAHCYAARLEGSLVESQARIALALDRFLSGHPSMSEDAAMFDQQDPSAHG